MKRILQLIAVAWAGWAGVAVAGLEVREVIWGFDGQVVPGHFNLLSVLVANPAGTAFDGNLVLYETRGLATRVGLASRGSLDKPA